MICFNDKELDQGFIGFHGDIYKAINILNNEKSVKARLFKC